MEGAFRSENRPMLVHSGHSGPYLYLSGVAVVMRSIWLGRPRAGHGSKRDEKTGYAIVNFKNNKEIFHSKKRISNHATVFTAELLAINEAIDYIIVNNFPNTIIVSDSRSVLDALGNANNKDTNIHKLNEKIASFKGIINFEWIKAHEGFAGNETADRYAKEATLNDNIECYIKYSKIQIKNKINKDIKLDWQNSWNSSKNARDLYLIFPNINIKRICGDFLLNQILTTHGALASYQHRFFGKPEICGCEDAREDRNHIVYNCKKWHDARKREFPTDFQKLSIRTLLNNKKSRTLIRGMVEENFMEIMNDLESSYRPGLLSQLRPEVPHVFGPDGKLIDLREKAETILAANEEGRISLSSARRNRGEKVPVTFPSP
ncbi:RNase H domain-containing protein [Caerostris darwini]|uniref:RNase H domain-containing protein n=1 Tax=Caerostris darwini TaxID=1538125 RepID=A0AAV4MDH8_9ARAC|nr:RNase H domain-containing protein [Caerostris darwini]